MDINQLKFPVGNYIAPQEITQNDIESWIKNIELFPQKLSELVASLTSKELNYIYRPGGWTVKQVIHHLADSHLNSFTRFKLTLTEEKPIVRPYQEAQWAETIDANNDQIDLSLNILYGLHERWAMLLKNLTSADFDRTYFHPDDQKQYTMKWMLGLYDWHCRHHFAHIEQALKHEGIFH